MWKRILLLALIGSDLGGSKIFYKANKKQYVEPTDCTELLQSKAQIDTVDIFPNMEFTPSWLQHGQFWDDIFEERCIARHNFSTSTLKVYVVPHSHNDVGWLWTFDQYFWRETKFIIDNIINKLQQYPNMTFIWSEISFLSKWWDSAISSKQEELKQLVHSGRLEITTGGWVMPDEACTHIYALLDQLIEGHQWIKGHLGVSPKTGWSIDAFGHGPTVPYLLDRSGLQGSIIQRIHYVWKQWLAQRQIEDFYWMPGWRTKKPSMIMHNQPFDMYSIESSCGPQRDICQEFDFVDGDNLHDYEPITATNLKVKSKSLLEQYERIGSLTEHNVVLVPLGDDSRYSKPDEFDAQYTNYMMMFNYINAHQELFHAHVQFGTPLDYFNEVRKRQKSFPSLKGDFFVYSDIFSEGKPAYWSGYYTTRPYVKILARQLEHHLRTAEILFTFAKHSSLSNISGKKRSKQMYWMLIYARRSLALFQHHNGITGTSTQYVISDFVARLHSAVYRCTRVQEEALRALMLPAPASAAAVAAAATLQAEIQWDANNAPLNKLKVSLADRNKILLFNSLTEKRTDVVTVRVTSSAIRLFDNEKKRDILYQISPIMEYQGNERRFSADFFDLTFVATVPALSTRIYTIKQHEDVVHKTVVFCNTCEQSEIDMFKTERLKSGDIHFENSMLKLVVKSSTGFLRQIFRKDVNKKHYLDIYFGAYRSQKDRSGFYLFKPDENYPEKNILHEYSDEKPQQDRNIVMISGPVFTEVTTMYLPILVHTVRIYHVEHPVLSRAVLVENVIDFESPPKNRETELYMRIQTDIQNGDVPEFYTDQNGFQYQKRVKVPKLGIEGNYYPITTMAWLQDRDTRLTLVTNHAQGAAAFEPGHLEVMLDRRTLIDDQRGVGEVLDDNKRVSLLNWILLESMPRKGGDLYQVPSQAADYLSRTLNYPLHLYLMKWNDFTGDKLKPSLHLVKGFPAGLHLVTLRTGSTRASKRSPGRHALLVLQRPGTTCAVGHARFRDVIFTKNSTFVGPFIDQISSVSLTGLHTVKSSVSLTDIILNPMELKTYRLTFT